MYKCTDCDKLYDIKPEYCECGNNLFEEIITASGSDVYENKTAVNVGKIIHRKSFYEQYPGIKRFVDSLDVVSVSFFVICLILSFLALVFINPVSDTASKDEHKTVKQTVKNIPDIEKLWNDALPSSSTSSVSVNIDTKPPLSTSKTDGTTVKKEKPVVTQTTKTKSLDYNSNSKTNRAAVSKTTSKTVPVSKPKTPVKTTAKTTAKPTAVSTPKTSASSSANAKTSQSVKKHQVVQNISPVQSAKNDEEWYNYRVALRQALFHNLSVTSINGSGKCQIEFSIDKNGKFINRAFSYQSPNESVNQAVYKMMMKLPSYYPPPESYNGQKVKMVFSFDNGSYYINYVN